MQDSRTPRLVEHFWVPILGAACSNKLFVGTVRPSQLFESSRFLFTKGALWLPFVVSRLVDWQRGANHALLALVLSVLIWGVASSLTCPW